MMKISLNRELCVRCKHCVKVCPDVFEIAQDGKAKLKVQESTLESVKIAAEDCPVGAISLS